MEYPPDRATVHPFADEPPRRDDARRDAGPLRYAPARRESTAAIRHTCRAYTGRLVTV